MENPTSAPTCASCAQPLTGRYCAHCGERRITAHDLTFAHFVEQALEALTHADGKVFGTVRRLITQPGRLTSDYLAGRRRAHIQPLQLFLICNVVFFLALPLIRWDTLSTTLQSHLFNSSYQRIAQHLVTAKLGGTNVEFTDYEAKFDHQAAVVGKSCVILLAVFYTLPVALLYRDRRRPTLGYLIYALHFTAFLLLTWLVWLGALDLIILGGRWLGSKPGPALMDQLAFVPVLMACAWYLYRSGQNVFGESWRQTASKTSILLLLFPVILSAYRFVLLWITLATT